jgi:hypothetical protein
VPTKDSLLLAKQFFPSIRLAPDVLANSEEAYEREVEGAAAALSAEREGDGVDTRGNTALNGKPAQMRGSSATSKAKDSGFSRFAKRIGKLLGKEITEKQAALIAEELGGEDGKSG